MNDAGPDPDPRERPDSLAAQNPAQPASAEPAKDFSDDDIEWILSGAAPSTSPASPAGAVPPTTPAEPPPSDKFTHVKRSRLKRRKGETAPRSADRPPPPPVAATPSSVTAKAAPPATAARPKRFRWPRMRRARRTPDRRTLLAAAAAATALLWLAYQAVGPTLLSRSPARPVQAGSKTITGSVSWRGQPLALGTIVFIDVAKKQADAADIVDGRYSLTVRWPGPKRVEIRAPANSAPAAGPWEPYREQIPKEFNTRSRLQLDVSQADPRELSFEL